MLTGVSRFSKMTIFSGMNNLNDISFFDKYSAICGFTKEEILKNMNEGVKNMQEIWKSLMKQQLKKYQKV